jgi:alpha-beta hydrolase superfamily lysophospholipase
MAAPQWEHPWLPNILAGLAIASGIGYLAAAYTASRWLTKATPGRPRRTPADHGFPCELFTCTTLDGHRLAGWIVTPPRPRATIILCHGLHENREQTLGRVVLLAGAGYRCVAFDHRAHGQSTGKRTSFGYYESRDVLAVVEMVRQRWPREPRAALGISMGAAALCYAASRMGTLDAVILESLYHDIGRAFTSRLQSYPPWFQRLGPGILRLTERRLGVSMSQLAPVEHIGDFALTPVLLVTGSEDRRAPPTDVQCLYERCRGPRELWLVPGAAHLDVFETGGERYQECVLDFLERRLSACLIH